MKENMLKLAEKVLSTSQYLSLQSNNKRVIERHLMNVSKETVDLQVSIVNSST